MAKLTAGQVATQIAREQGGVTVTMTQDKVTKNAVRYAEDHASETEADKIGQLYLQKSTFPNGAPQQIRVTVEAL